MGGKWRVLLGTGSQGGKLAPCSSWLWLGEGVTAASADSIVSAGPETWGC